MHSDYLNEYEYHYLEIKYVKCSKKITIQRIKDNKLVLILQ
jgi:hypothetical protein